MVAARAFKKEFEVLHIVHFRTEQQVLAYPVFWLGRSPGGNLVGVWSFRAAT